MSSKARLRFTAFLSLTSILPWAGTANAASFPATFPENVAVSTSYMGCGFQIQRGNYLGEAYSKIRNTGWGSNCIKFRVGVSATNGNVLSKSWNYPANWSWKQTNVTGTFYTSHVWVRATGYGLVCDVEFTILANGTAYPSISKISGVGNCPESP
ncbi:hypothetical protein [Paraliomyxa miuraensis]|uniref:hypothetical protein n=1 Tax=Paraliomyxa miuraensis TaxID=376150 RepID=UPI0022536D84|nr:hypothetical protein [Paraliomyxa miuraensis]MCX4240216.1 hypothetical protein [Paraliomyxa miuraensis]